jgi:hypothetical protein
LSKYKVYGIENAASADIFLTEIKQNFAAEIFFCPLTMKTIHLILPQEGIAFATCGGRFGYSANVSEKINLPAYVDSSPREENAVLAAAFEAMKSARASHDKIEKIFANAMNFSEVDKLAEKIIRKLKIIC